MSYHVAVPVTNAQSFYVVGVDVRFSRLLEPVRVYFMRSALNFLVQETVEMEYTSDIDRAFVFSSEEAALAVAKYGLEGSAFSLEEERARHER